MLVYEFKANKLLVQAEALKLLKKFITRNKSVIINNVRNLI